VLPLDFIFCLALQAPGQWIGCTWRQFPRQLSLSLSLCRANSASSFSPLSCYESCKLFHGARWKTRVPNDCNITRLISHCELAIFHQAEGPVAVNTQSRANYQRRDKVESGERKTRETHTPLFSLAERAAICQNRFSGCALWESAKWNGDADKFNVRQMSAPGSALINHDWRAELTWCYLECSQRSRPSPSWWLHPGRRSLTRATAILLNRLWA
jgi:hypothetical protein